MQQAELQCFGRTVPRALVGELRVTDPQLDATPMRRRLAEDGYLRFRGVLDRDEIHSARIEVFSRLAEVGEVRPPTEAGIATGVSRRQAVAGDLGGFWRSVCEGAALRRASHGPALRGLMERVIGSPVRPFDFLWLRAMIAGRASPLHFDRPYMGRGSAAVLTAWIPLGDVPKEEGPLLIVEGAHRFDDLVENFRDHDVDRDASRPGHVPEHAIDLATRRQCRLLTSDFAAGDVVIFSLLTLHGSFDNMSTANRVRLSCDVRYQPATDPVDERWIGAPPPGHGGKSYGGLSGAQPLTAPPLRR